MIFLALWGVFILLSLYFLFLGANVLLTRKPYVMRTKYNFYVVFFALASQLIIPVRGVIQLSGSVDRDIDWFTMLSPIFLGLFYSVLLFFLWKTMQGYSVIGVDEESFRTSLVSVLTQLGLPFEERISKMRLTSLDTDLDSAINAWSGAATVKIRDAGHRKTEKKIAQGLQTHFSNEKVTLNLRTSYFYILVGSLLFLFSIGFAYWTWNRDSFWNSY